MGAEFFLQGGITRVSGDGSPLEGSSDGAKVGVIWAKGPRRWRQSTRTLFPVR